MGSNSTTASPTVDPTVSPTVAICGEPAPKVTNRASVRRTRDIGQHWCRKLPQGTCSGDPSLPKTKQTCTNRWYQCNVVQGVCRASRTKPCKGPKAVEWFIGPEWSGSCDDVCQHHSGPCSQQALNELGLSSSNG